MELSWTEDFQRNFRFLPGPFQWKWLHRPEGSTSKLSPRRWEELGERPTDEDQTQPPVFLFLSSLQKSSGKYLSGRLEERGRRRGSRGKWAEPPSDWTRLCRSGLSKSFIYNAKANKDRQTEFSLNLTWGRTQGTTNHRVTESTSSSNTLERRYQSIQ